MSRLRALWWRVRDGLWFVPAVLVASATALAVALVELSGAHELELQAHWPRLFGVGAEGSRGLLAAIAGTMLTVAGTVFTVTLAVLSLAASQYSPRVLRSFMADRPTQVVLGVFVAVFAYCLVVLRTIRAGDEPFVPSLAVLVGIVLAFAAVGFLIYFIHHLASSIEASSIVARVARGTHAAVDALYREQLDEAADEATTDPRAAGINEWMPVLARATGYIVSVDERALLAFARGEGRVVRMELAVGDFAIQGQPLASLAGGGCVSAQAQATLDRCYSFDRQRTIEQDAAFGMQQVVDVGLKALSPGINDQSTAVLCIDRLCELLVRLASRRIERPFRGDESVIWAGPTYARLAGLAFGDLRDSAAGKPMVLARLISSIERVAAATAHPRRRAVLAAELEKITLCARRTLPPEAREGVLAQAARVRGAWAVQSAVPV
jgi:uncharacterized membrane protein